MVLIFVLIGMAHHLRGEGGRGGSGTPWHFRKKHTPYPLMPVSIDSLFSHAVSSTVVQFFLLFLQICLDATCSVLLTE